MTLATGQPGALAPNPAHELAVELAAGLLARRSGFRPIGRPADLGSSVTLEVARGRRREPGDASAVVDTEQRYIVTIVKGAQQ